MPQKLWRGAIVDVHTHAFPEDIAPKIVKAIVSKYGIFNVYPCTIGSLLKETARVKVASAIVQVYANSPKSVYYLNDWASDIQEKYKPKIFCFGTVHPNMADPEKELDRLIKLGLKGVKLQPTVQQFVPDNPKLFRIYEKLTELNLPVLFHAGKERAPIPKIFAHPKSFINILRSFPKLVIILAHMGGLGMWNQVSQLADYKNAFFDTSCTVPEMSSKELEKLLKIFIIDNIFFGSDFPWFDYNEILKGMMKLDLPEEQKTKILWRNAVRILNFPINSFRRSGIEA